MTRTAPRLSSALFLLLPAAAAAHPGHGSVEADSALHYFAEPVHALLLAAALAGGIVALWARRGGARRRRSRDAASG